MIAVVVVVVAIFLVVVFVVCIVIIVIVVVGIVVVVTVVVAAVISLNMQCETWVTEKHIPNCVRKIISSSTSTTTYSARFDIFILACNFWCTPRTHFETNFIPATYKWSTRM